MFEARLLQGSLLKKITGVIKDVVDEGYWDYSADGISMQALDCGQVALLSLHLPANEFFDNFKCDHQGSVGINFAAMFDICADAAITMKMNKPGSYILQSGQKVFEMESPICDDRQLIIPDTNYDCIVKMSTTELQRICQDLSRSVTISCSRRKGITFTGSGNIKTANIMKLQNPPVTIELVTSQLARFVNSPLAPEITLYILRDSPIKLEYKIKETGYVRYYLAPIMKRGIKRKR